MAKNLQTLELFTTGDVRDIHPGLLNDRTAKREHAAGNLQGYEIPGGTHLRFTRKNVLQWLRKCELPMNTVEKGAGNIGVVATDELYEELMAQHANVEGMPTIERFDTSFELGVALEKREGLNDVVVDQRVVSERALADIRKFLADQQETQGREITATGVLQSDPDAAVNGFVAEHNVASQGNEAVARQILEHYSENAA